MRASSWMLGAALAAFLGPAAVADATADRAVIEALDQAPRCGPSGDEDIGAPIADMVKVDGFGDYSLAVDTDSREAQAWFDHGVRLRWAFEHGESVRAFRKARLLDPACGLCAWGEAWAMGPNLNGGGGGEETRLEALATAREARRLSRDATPWQRQMIDALIQRYSGKEETRAARFAQRMDRVARRNPNELLLASVTADAWMLADYDWWDADGKAANPGITRAMGLLEHALSVDPDDEGAIHLYIHLTEWSDDPHKAIPYGEKLARLAPGASHLVHMPSHTFYRVGRYRDAMMSNVNAVALDHRYNELARPPGGINGMPLHGHNIHFGMGGALMSGAGDEGLELADAFMDVFAEIPESNLWRQFTANNAYAIYGRYGSAEQVAALAEPPASQPLLRISRHYARGEAAARAGDPALVREEAQAIAAIRAATTFSGPTAENQDGFTEISQRILEGRAAMLEENWAAARIAYGRAAEIHGQGGGRRSADRLVSDPAQSGGGDARRRRRGCGEIHAGGAADRLAE
ncbi:hypothetical protein [Brevundimonas lutea]|uniref:hypothetical protein n=1 Tax=Brevundimonas lutea TaxID=2293980 RepID=UPI00196A5EF9|nr:hypothetical protein [Brevundimonas lutea]